LPACRYIASQDAAGIGKKAGQRIIEKIRMKKAINIEYKKPDERIIRLPVTIINAETYRGKNGDKSF
jgi:hypothetical protein